MTEIDQNQNKTTIIDEDYHCELNFHSLFAEGTNLTRQGNYSKAIDAFTKVKIKNTYIIISINNAIYISVSF